MIPRRSLDEILVRYESHPTLKDLYVEGRQDHAIIKWFLDRNNRTDICVYDIDAVEIPKQCLRSLKLNEHSNRDKLIALSEVLSTKYNKRKIKVRCMADADFDRHLHTCRSNYILEYTDYTSMEIYFFKKSFIEKFLDLVLSGFPISPCVLLAEMSKTLPRIFLIRLANEKLKWNMTWIGNTFRKYVSWDTKKLTFREDRFIRSYLMKNGKINELGCFKRIMKSLESALHKEPRHNIMGHDFTHVFFLAIKKKKTRRCFGDLATFEHSLCGCLELAFVESEPLFVKIGTL